MTDNIFENAEIRTKNLFCEFTSDERASKGDQLADKRIRMDELKDEAAALNKEKGDLDKEILSISKLLKHGGEERFVKCLVAYNYPEDGSKTIKRSDTGEEWIETMVDADYKLFSEKEHEEQVPENEIFSEDESDQQSSDWDKSLAEEEVSSSQNEEKE